ncbi:MAG: reverse transcriptase domain-containing protein, partial [Gloeomargaritales cyanobacterium]
DQPTTTSSPTSQRNDESNTDETETSNPTFMPPGTSILSPESELNSGTVPGEEHTSAHASTVEHPATEADDQRNLVRGEYVDPIDSGEEMSTDGTTDEMTEEVYNYFNKEPPSENRHLDKLVNNRWHNAVLQVCVLWDSGDHDWIDAKIVKLDEPLTLARYLLANPVDRTRSGYWSTWARKTVKSIGRTIRRMHRICNTSAIHEMSIEELPYRKSRRLNNYKKKRPSRNQRKPTEVKYGIKVPRNVEEALEFDKQNKSNAWAEAIDKEMSSLNRLNCFRYHTKWKPSSDFQYAPLRMIFTVKSDLRRKARLVVGGHVVDAGDLPTYASTVKGMSVRLLFMIAAINDLDVLSADIENAFVNAYTNEKIYTRAGPEFGEHEGKLVEIIKALSYGLKTSARRFHAHLADSLRSLGFKQTRYDPDVWYRDRGDGGYDYLCTHVDDILVLAKEPKQYMDKLSEKYTLRDVKQPDYYLDSSFTRQNGRWYCSAGTYIKEAISRIEAKHGTLRKERTPLPQNDHPE